jgi:putative transposase
MPSSYLSLHYHLVFSTKHREPLLSPAVVPRVYDYIGGITRGLGGQLLVAGGIPDHVHLLVRLGATRAGAEVLRDLKAESSKWIHRNLPDLATFRWQIGYGAFAVSVSNLPDVKAYIENQEEHHRTRTYQQEFVALLDRHGIEYDERYLWD